MHLIVGATGIVGGGVARELAAGGEDVRALVRNAGSRAETKDLRQAGIEVVDGDLLNPRSLERACLGVESVVCTATSMPDPGPDGLRRVDREGVQALIDAAIGAGVQKFVYTSFSGNLEHPCPLRDAKREAERKLRESGLRAVILRPSYFAEVWLGPHLGFDPVAGRVRVYGSGEAGISYISTGDVVRFAVEAAVREHASDDTLEMGGPRPVTQLEAVRIFEHAFGRELEVERVPVEVIRDQHQSDDPVQRTFGALMLGCTQGDAVPDAVGTARRYGIELRSVEDWAREWAEDS